MLNQIVLVGRLVKDPVLKETEQGKNVRLSLLPFLVVLRTQKDLTIPILSIVSYGMELLKTLLNTVKRAMSSELKEGFRVESTKWIIPLSSSSKSLPKK